MHTPMRQTCFLASSLRRMLSATGITPARMYIHLPQRSPMLRPATSSFFARSTPSNTKRLDTFRGFTSTADGSHDGPKAEPKTKRSTRLYAAGFLVVAGVSYYLYDPQSFRWHYVAISRSARTTLVCAVMALDYKLTLSRNYPSQQAYQDAKSACHERCAKWMLWVCNLNGGIYIKLGQHIAALQYLLPVEYTETMKVLQDRCPPSTLAALEALFLQDTNSTLSDHFSDLDPTPLGVASLAQVHKATLKSTGEVVAVKIQHPHLDEHAPIDIKICGWFASRVRKVFPEFEFDWLADELRESLPMELNFVKEAENAREVARNFAGDTVVKIPEVLWAKRRILVMEYINGGKVDNLEYMKNNGINVHDLSHELSKAFFKMIFFDGFVHCDPHPGNVFVRPKKRSSFYIPIISDLFFSRSHNFEIVLLDHGLYRRLTDSLRLDYAHLWDSLIRGNEEDILKYSHRIFTRPTTAIPAKDGIDHHRLFASMLTGRSWALISSSNGTGTASALATARTSSELDEVHTKVQSGRFFIAIAEVLAKLPREVLLLLKTNDLLRAVDDDLGVTKGSGESIMTGMMRRVALMGWYCAVVIRDRTLEELAARSTFVMPSWTRGEFWNAWSLYLNVVARIAVLDAWVYARQLVE